MAGTWTSIFQTKVDSENYISGNSAGTYLGCQKISEAIATTGDTLDGLGPVTAADIQSIFFYTDYACDIVITLGTGSKTISLDDGGYFYWDVNSNITTPFAYNLVSAVVNFSGTAPTITGRICYN